jgi:hypothetical protein
MLGNTVAQIRFPCLFSTCICCQSSILTRKSLASPRRRLYLQQSEVWLSDRGSLPNYKNSSRNVSSNEQPPVKSSLWRSIVAGRSFCDLDQHRCDPLQYVLFRNLFYPIWASPFNICDLSKFWCEYFILFIGGVMCAAWADSSSWRPFTLLAIVAPQASLCDRVSSKVVVAGRCSLQVESLELHDGRKSCIWIKFEFYDKVRVVMVVLYQKPKPFFKTDKVYLPCCLKY